MDTTAVSIELGGSSHHHCACCQQDSETIHGFLYDRGGDTAVYMASFTRTHQDAKVVDMVLSLGGWGENTGPADRLATPLRAVRDADGIRLDFVSPESSPWFGDSSVFGEMAVPDEHTDEFREALVRLAMFALEGDPRLASYIAPSSRIGLSQ